MTVHPPDAIFTVRSYIFFPFDVSVPVAVIVHAAVPSVIVAADPSVMLPATEYVRELKSIVPVYPTAIVKTVHEIFPLKVQFTTLVAS